MKSNILKLTATVLSALVFTACGSRNTDIDPAVPDKPAPEQPFLYISAADFKEINVPVTIADEPSTVEPKILDLSSLDFGEKLPACKTAENYEKYRPYDETGGDGSGRAQYFEESLGLPEKGLPLKCFPDGKNLYFKVSYDYLSCSHEEHEWSIFKYDTESDSLTEVYIYSSEDEAVVSPEAVIDGKVYLFSADPETNSQRLTEYDPETSIEKKIYEPQNFNLISGNELIISDGVSRMQYDTESGGWRELAAEYEIESGAVKAYSDNEINAKLISEENSRNGELLTDFYRIGTGAANADILYASKNKAVLCTTDGRRLHTYDLDKKEHYITELSGFGEAAPVCCNGKVVFPPYLVRGERTKAYIFDPELGTANPIEESLPEYYGKSEDIVCFAESTAAVNAMGYEIHYYDILQNLYWFEA